MTDQLHSNIDMMVQLALNPVGLVFAMNNEGETVDHLTMIKTFLASPDPVIARATYNSVIEHGVLSPDAMPNFYGVRTLINFGYFESKVVSSARLVLDIHRHGDKIPEDMCDVLLVKGLMDDDSQSVHFPQHYDEASFMVSMWNTYRHSRNGNQEGLEKNLTLSKLYRDKLASSDSVLLKNDAWKAAHRIATLYSDIMDDSLTDNKTDLLNRSIAFALDHVATPDNSFLYRLSSEMLQDFSQTYPQETQRIVERLVGAGTSFS